MDNQESNAAISTSLTKYYVNQKLKNWSNKKIKYIKSCKMIQMSKQYESHKKSICSAIQPPNIVLVFMLEH